jgi:hypothetical protein
VIIGPSAPYNELTLLEASSSRIQVPSEELAMLSLQHVSEGQHAIPSIEDTPASQGQADPVPFIFVDPEPPNLPTPIFHMENVHELMSPTRSTPSVASAMSPGSAVIMTSPRKSNWAKGKGIYGDQRDDRAIKSEWKSSAAKQVAMANVMHAVNVVVPGHGLKSQAKILTKAAEVILYVLPLV